MPPQDRAPVQDANLEPMSMNLKEGSHSVVNRGESLTTIDFSGDVNLAEKEGAGMAGRGCPTWDRHIRMDEAKVVVGQRKRVWRSRTWRSGSGGLMYRTRAHNKGKEGEADCRGRNHRCCRLEEEEVKSNNYQRKPERGRGVWQWVRVRRRKPKMISLTGEEEADGEEGTSRTSDRGAMTPLVRDCNRGRRCDYVAAVEEAGTSTFGVVEAIVDVVLKPMTMNLKEGSRYVVNRDEDLMTVDFDGDVSLDEKEVIVLSIAWLWRKTGRWQWLGATATVEDSTGSDERLMEEKVRRK
ncbi:hypothetical protein B296_00008256 [Ensete ventricosum]|uniref:Uncharacterized protein n=1 Tax=Ensete ventricosum TaxID=4639 RepID=A0A427AND2_ENSVE|nr:hypothetical protein B296_00008256 [Ensete ventricosum]